jgi:Flp pilus assembly secretin CpaC
VDVAVSVAAGDVHFERPSAIDWAESADPSIATIEVLRSGEVLVSGKAPGQTVALLYAEGKMGVWRLTVTKPGEAVAAVPGPSIDAAKEVCKGLTLGEKGSEGALTVTVPDDACRKALLAVLQTDAFNSHELTLTFEVPALQAQLQAFTQAIAPFAPDVKASYVGAGLVLEGKVTKAQHRKILWAAFRNSVGRVPLEDKLEVEKPKVADGGTP